MSEKDVSRQLAVALSYRSRKERAPRVSAKGRGHIAKKILELAKKHNIPVREDSDLVQLLGKLDLNQEIPPDLYKVVAEVLVFIYGMNKKFGT